MTRNEMKDTLAKFYWTRLDIQKYFGIGNTKSSQVMQDAKRIVLNKYMSSKAQRDAILKIMGTSFDEQIRIINLLEE